MTNEEKRNIYNNIQNLYNMDFNTWQEVLAMLYNLVADVEQKFEAFEQKFELMLGKEVTEAIRELYENGKLTEIINEEIFSDLNNKIDKVKNDITIALTNEVNRINNKIENVNEQLEHIVHQIEVLEYGKLLLPDDFNKLTDFEFYRDSYGGIKSTYKLEDLFTVEKNIYLSEQGSDTNDGLTRETSLRTLEKAFSIAQSQSVNNIAINIMNKYFSSGGAGSSLNISLTKNILIRPDESLDRCFIGTFSRNDTNSWVDNNDGTFSLTTSSVPSYILDGGVLDYRKIPYEYERLADNTNGLKKGTWSYDTVNKKIQLMPFRTFKYDNIIRIYPYPKNVFTINNKILAFKNLDLLYNSNVADTNQRGYGGLEVVGGSTNSKFIFDNCSSSYAYKNGIYIDDVNYTYVINSTCTNNGADGFNYDGKKDGKRYELVVEYNSHSYNNGRLRNSNGTNNATTAHGGVHILRVGSIGYNSDGPTCADVQGCYSILYDCHMRDNKTYYPNSDTDCSYWFDNDGYSNQGKVIMINCDSPKNDSGYGLSTDGEIEVFVKNFKGKIKNNIPINYF